ncbi:MAG: hypothetical protein WHV44_17650 [Anaerolineales bacterium]
MTDTEREHVLRMIEDGKITAEEGLRLMQALEAEAPEDEGEPVVIEAPATPEPPTPSDETAKREFQSRVNTLRRLWLIPLGLGIASAIPGAWWMYLNVQAGLNGWFIFPFLFFLFGVGLVALGAGSRTARWIYLDVREPRDSGTGFQRIRLAFPIPTGLIRWGMRTFGRRMPDQQRAKTDDILRAVFESEVLDEPILVDVKEDSGQHARVYIG